MLAEPDGQKLRQSFRRGQSFQSGSTETIAFGNGGFTSGISLIIFKSITALTSTG